MSGLLNYVTECLHLLNWVYFKPFTFKEWLRDIHPDLNPTENPFARQAEFAENPSLQLYARQVWWLNIVVVQLVVLLVAPIYYQVLGNFFNWSYAEILYLGWAIGLWLATNSHSKILRWGYSFIFVVFALTLLWNLGWTPKIIIFLSSYEILKNINDLVQLLEIIRPLGIGVTAGLLFGMDYGLAFGLAFGVSLSLGGGMLSGRSIGVSSGLAFGLTNGLGLGLIVKPPIAIVISVLTGIMIGISSAAPSGVTFGVTTGVVTSFAAVLGVLRIYFWLPELLWMGLLFLFTPKNRFASKLRYLPPYFDQVIYLPLPFMSTMLLEAYREKPNAARQTISYITNSTNQQKVAAKAIVNIALDTLERCQNLHDIIAVNEELAWIPNPSPPEISTVLPQFLDISRSVQSANMATSVYRKTEILKNPIDSLSQMQNSFAFIKNPRIATTASNIAQKWLSILETARRNLQEQALYAQEIPQVYIAGNALDPETAQSRFKGRQDIFWEIENIALMSPPPTLLLYGGRRTGKTSTLKYLPQKVGGDLIPLRVDVQGIADAITLPGLAKSLVQQIIDSARTSRNLTLPPPDKEELKTEPFPTLRDWFTMIECIAPGKRFLLCIDEFERLEEVIATTNSRAPLNFLRHVIQHRNAWTLLFSGSHTLDEIEDYWSDYLINTRSVRVTYLEPPEAEELIVHPVPEFPDIYLPETVNRIIYWTRCQPYLVQLLCSELVDYLNREHSQNALNVKATPQDVDNIIDRALITGSAYFDELWKNTLNEQQRESIRNLVNQTQPTSGDHKIWRKLIQKEILECENGDQIRFQVPFIERSILQKIEEEL